MATTLVPAGASLWSHPRVGDLVEYPFRSNHVRKVVQVFDNGDVALDELTATAPATATAPEEIVEG